MQQDPVLESERPSRSRTVGKVLIGALGALLVAGVVAAATSDGHGQPKPAHSGEPSVEKGHGE